MRKYAAAQILGIKSTNHQIRNASLEDWSDYQDYKTDDGYLYTRVRAISSRVNKNFDGWPSAELSRTGSFGYQTFNYKPIFIDHNNHDPQRARGIVVDSKLHVVNDFEKASALDPYYATAPANHKPPTWIELLLETDARSFPKLAQSIITGKLSGVSMGANVRYSVCSVCGNKAEKPDDYCIHIRHKGHKFNHKLAYEDCHDVQFFEISYVFDPADETADILDFRHAKAKTSFAITDSGLVVYSDNPLPQSMEPHAPDHVNTLRQVKVCPVCGSDLDDGKCGVCHYEEPPEGLNNPDIEKAKQVMQEQQQAEQSSVPEGAPPGGGSPPDGGGGQPGMMPGMAPQSNTTNSSNSNQITNRQAGKINKNEVPILPPTKRPTDQAKDKRTVTNQSKPVESHVTESSMKYTKEQMEGFVAELLRRKFANNRDHAINLINAAIKHAEGTQPVAPEGNADQRVPVDGVGGFDNVTLDNFADQHVPVDGVGGFDNNAEAGTEHEDVAKATEVANSGPTKTWSGNGDQAAPVTSETPQGGPVGEQLKAGKQAADGYNAPQNGMFGDEVAPEKRIDLDQPLMDENTVGQPTQTWSENKVNGQEQAPPVTSEQPFTDVKKSNRAQWIAALRTAETEIELGLLPEEEKYNRLNVLENEPSEVLEARLETLGMVKGAGLAKPGKNITSRLQGLSVPRVASAAPADTAPSTYGTAPARLSKTVLDDAALFI